METEKLQTDIAPSNKKKFWTLAALGTFGTSILIHLGVLFLVGGVVIIQGVIPKTNFVAATPVETVQDEVAPTPDEPVSAPDTPTDTAATDLALPPVPDAAPAPELITTATVNPSQTLVMTSTFANASTAGLGASGNQATASGGSGKRGGMHVMANPFGATGESSDGLVGYFYDLKQTPDRKPFPQAYTPALFAKVVTEFIQKDWNTKVLEPFYKVKKPMTAYEICIPQMEAAQAPKAFGVEKDVQPKGLLVHYTGTIIAPATGSFRFVGNGDDILFVRFGHKTVLNTSSSWVPGLSEQLKGKVPLANGSWIQMYQGESYPMEVLIGEQPGGLFHAFLLIQERSEKPAIDPVTGLPILRVFQTAATKIPQYPLFPKSIRNPKVADEAFVCEEAP